MTAYNGITRCDYESWEKCKLQNPDCGVEMAEKDNRCMWLNKDIGHCTNPDIQETMLREYQKGKIS